VNLARFGLILDRDFRAVELPCHSRAILWLMVITVIHSGEAEFSNQRNGEFRHQPVGAVSARPRPNTLVRNSYIEVLT
jgi:hypothetical protein